MNRFGIFVSMLLLAACQTTPLKQDLPISNSSPSPKASSSASSSAPASAHHPMPSSSPIKSHSNSAPSTQPSDVPSPSSPRPEKPVVAGILPKNIPLPTLEKPDQHFMGRILSSNGKLVSGTVFVKAHYPDRIVRYEVDTLTGEFNFILLEPLDRPLELYAKKAERGLVYTSASWQLSTGNSPSTVRQERFYDLELQNYYMPAPTPTPSPEYDCGHCYSGKTSLHGIVFDERSMPLKNVTIEAKSLNPDITWQAKTTTDVKGKYAFNDAPPGIQIEVMASKPNFATRRRVEVLTSNKQGDPNANRYDFGNDGTTFFYSALYQALSSEPEINKVSPGRNAAGVHPQTSFILHFSEPMDTQSVEKALRIRSYNTRQFTVDQNNQRTGIETLVNRRGEPKEINRNQTVKGLSEIESINGTLIYDISAFNPIWNADKTQLTLNFKPGYTLPTDKDSNLVPDYQVSFDNLGPEPLLGQDGSRSSSRIFKLTDGSFERSYKFSIQTDEDRPEVTGLEVLNGDLVLSFSEPMALNTLSKIFAAGMSEQASDLPLAPAAYPDSPVFTPQAVAQNYTLKVHSPQGTLLFEKNWAELQGQVVYDQSQSNPSRVILKSDSPELTPYKSSGHVFDITAAKTVRDPAGNALSLTQNSAAVVWP